MPRHIPADQAHELASQYRAVLSRISAILGEVKDFQQKCAALLEALVLSQAYHDALSLSLKQGRPLDDRIPELEHLTFAFNKAIALSRPAEYLQGARDYFLKNCSQPLKLLEGAPTGLARIARSSQLDAVDQAYDTLQAFFQEFAGDVATADRDIHEVLQSVDHDRWSAPCNMPGNMRRARPLLDLIEPISVPEVEDLVGQWEQMQALRAQADDLTQQAADAVKDAVDSYRATAAIDALSEQPVETLSQMKRRVRVKALRDRGYDTLADIYFASVNRLEAISGIGSETAWLIRGFVLKQRDELVDQSKVRLSYDARDSKSGQLVLALAEHRMAEAVATTLGEALAGNDPFVLLDVHDLDPLSNLAAWPFTDRGTRSNALQAYARLASVVNGEARTACAEASRRLADLESLSVEDAWEDFRTRPVDYNVLLEQIVPGCLEADDAYYGLPEELAHEIENEDFFPHGLLCTLRRYQEWGVKYILHQERVLLGDEMGLGKTIQAIATMVSLRNTGQTHFLVVCPASVVTNWCREVERRSRLTAIKIHGTERRTALARWKSDGGVAVTTYETLRTLDLSGQAGLIVVDEAHYVKNPEATRSKAVAQLCASASRVLFMTGTPLENNVDEMIRLVQILRPSLVSRLRQLAQLGRAAEFRNELIGVYYRRKREDVLTELPELIEKIEWCQMTSADREAYRKAAWKSSGNNPHALRRVSWDVADLSQSSKAQKLLELADEAERDGRKLLVFSFYLDTIKAVRRLLGERCSQPITGSVPSNQRQRIIDDFDAAKPGSALAAQIQAGGTGLNIQSASIVVICEPQYKPSIESQAISRAYRMGQARNVLVYRLLCSNSIDQRVMDLLDEKQRAFDMYADTSVAAKRTAELDDKKMANIVEEEIERIRQEQASGAAQSDEVEG